MSGPPISPIEEESFRIIAERVDLRPWGKRAGPVVARVIHASADLEYATTMVVPELAVTRGIEALRAGAPVVTDTEMVRTGIVAAEARCYLSEAKGGGELTRSAEAMRLAAERHPEGAVVVVGCAPTALFEVIRLNAAEGFEPALVIGLPVGFVGAAEAKESLRESGMVAISNVGEKGGSAVAAAVVNALGRMVHER